MAFQKYSPEPPNYLEPETSMLLLFTITKSKSEIQLPMEVKKKIKNTSR